MGLRRCATHAHEGRFALVAAASSAAMIDSSRLTDLLGEAEPTPRLVVLNSCSSGQAREDDLFAGTAAALVRGGVNAVAAMQFTVSDTAAIAFARGFYTAMAAGRDVNKAANSGRVAIRGHGSLEWVTPVLYVRGGSTRLFTLTGSPVPDEIAQSGAAGAATGGTEGDVHRGPLLRRAVEPYTTITSSCVGHAITENRAMDRKRTPRPLTHSPHAPSRPSVRFLTYVSGPFLSEPRSPSPSSSRSPSTKERPRDDHPRPRRIRHS